MKSSVRSTLMCINITHPWLMSGRSAQPELNQALQVLIVSRYLGDAAAPEQDKEPWALLWASTG